MNISVLLDSILTSFEVIIVLIIISYIWGKAQTSSKWFIILSVLTLGIIIYMMKTNILEMLRT